MLRASILVIALLLSTLANGQGTLFRAYLASDGSDANSCSLPQPCRLLPAALAAVVDGGEIWMLDSANYNSASVNVAKSVTILAIPGAVGSVVATGGPAINIATAGVNVALRNLVIVPLPGGGGTTGVTMSAGNRLTVEDCLIANMPGGGIDVTAAATVRIVDTTVRDSVATGIAIRGGANATLVRVNAIGNATGAGVQVSGSASMTTTADITQLTSASNQIGVSVFSSVAAGVVKASIRDSLVNRTNGIGVAVGTTAGAPVTLTISGSTVTNNSGTGIGVAGAGATVWASANTVTGNSIGLEQVLSGTFETAGNNAVRNNVMDKSGTITVGAME